MARPVLEPADPGCTPARCASCGYDNPRSALACGLCGEPFRGEVAGPGAWPSEPQPRALAPRRDAPQVVFDRASEQPIWGLPRSLFFYLVGVPAAVACVSGAFGQSYAWFLAALFHETGHTLAGLVLGTPSFPAISLTGHAATVHQEQKVGMAVTILIAVVAMAVWRWRSGARGAALMLAGLAVCYPVLAFVGPVRESVFLLGGHLGELAFAFLCLGRAWTGGFTHHSLERGAYSMVGWVLVGRNVALCWGLATSAAARAAYRGNGSFGLTNDYIRLAEDVWGWGLPAVAALMLVAGVLTPALAAGAGLLRDRVA